MGSLQEEELVQMVQDFIESEPSSPIVPSYHLQSSNHLAQLSTLQEILRCRTDTERKVLEIVLKHIRSKRAIQKSSGLKKWLAMRLKMNGFNASLCQTCWVTSSGCPAGDYEYVDIVMENENGETVRLIVDIDFKSQFELARPSPTYKELTDALPSIFIGSEEKLREIISVVCSAAKQSFREAGLHVPPWRTTTYMHSKWLSATPNVNGGFGKVNGEPKPRGGALGFSKWTPPMVKPKTQNRELGGGGSALSSQFSNMGINCC
ncbi:hypothetical protein ERO13_A05G385800v2 [Gossypium hirsutum]|uniref:Fidgetin-like protein 1 n=4 Tax=Gossypium TaxID=3633 RepID=A0A1U8PLU3_GOSHI|nr:uncharacterized protein LOC107959601 [Gossypium hirsutum]KAG4203192.1 hypothetical protein ERO13_A05G385800v2 [Gossypium hirsutum]TYH20464.1 hypothetical protein ES288_A05G431600v1 [Gossypium darwinii]TYI31149.1 hypothetical protein ES332_A05G433400v1 [Gossypium tomentosum]TYJ38066.1 hypothetical protein E1A91_A05G417200v1 [Gossypium mustelinum]